MYIIMTIYKAFNIYHYTVITNQNTTIYQYSHQQQTLRTHTHTGIYKHISDEDGRTEGKNVKRLWDKQMKIKKTERFGVIYSAKYFNFPPHPQHN